MRFLDASEAAGFALFLTTDTNLRYQQNLALWRLAIVVLTTTSWPCIQRVVASVKAIDASGEGSYIEVAIP